MKDKKSTRNREPVELEPADPEELSGQEQEKQERKGKVNKLKAGSLLLLGFMVVYIPSVFHWIYGGNVTTDILRMGTIEESYNAQGLVIRDELLLEAPPFSGRYIQEAGEGERVPVAGSVATILEKSSLGLLEELDKKNIEIVEAQNERAKNSEVYSEDITKIQDSIDESVKLLISESSNNSLTGIKPIRESINKLIEKRAEIVGSDSKDAHITKLKNERNGIQQKIDTNTKQIKSQFAGIISYVIDGCEQLTPSAIKGLTPQTLETFKPKSQGAVGLDSASAGKPFVKVIKGNTIYLAAVLDTQKAAVLKEEGNIKIRINDIDKIYSAVVTAVSQAVNGKSVITVMLDRGTEELSAIRKVNIDFIKDLHEGLKISAKSFKSIEPDGKSGTIVLVKANVTTLRTVEILGSNNEFAIIKTPEDELKKTISLYDSYIVDSRNVEEGQIINQ